MRRLLEMACKIAKGSEQQTILLINIFPRHDHSVHQRRSPLANGGQTKCRHKQKERIPQYCDPMFFIGSSIPSSTIDRPTNSQRRFPSASSMSSVVLFRATERSTTASFLPGLVPEDVRIAIDVLRSFCQRLNDRLWRPGRPVQCYHTSILVLPCSLETRHHV